MDKRILFAGVAATALMAGSLASLAQTVTATIEDFNQTSTNVGQIDNFGNITTSGDVSGTAATVSNRANGASTSASVLNINEEGTETNIAVDDASTSASQSSTNSGNISNYTIDGITVQDLTGAATSVSGTASGASASVSVVKIQTTGGSAIDGTNAVEIGTADGIGLTQTVTNSGVVTNVGADTSTGAALSSGELLGTASSVRSSASGAGASIAVTNIDSFLESETTIGADAAPVAQTVTNTGAVQNGVADSQNTISGAGLTGDGTSVAISASGASASVGVSNIWSAASVPLAEADQTAEINSVTQSVTNGVDGDSTAANVVNYGYITQTGDMSGVRATAVVAASGSSAGVSVSNLGTATDSSLTNGAEINADITSVSQTSTNHADITNGTSTNVSGVTLDGVNLSGNGAAISVSASGASASVSVSNILSATDVNLSEATINVAGVTQSVTNNGAIANYGTVMAGELSGAATSVSVSAIGASAGISVVNVSGIN